MPSLMILRKRIRSLKSSQKITGAMKLVAASRLKKAQATLFKARPYALALQTLLKRVIVGQELTGSLNPPLTHPLLAAEAELLPKAERKETPKTTLLVVLTSNRGLCGAFNANIFKGIQNFLQTERAVARERRFKLWTVGRKGRDYLVKRSKQLEISVEQDYSTIYDHLSFSDTLSLATALSEVFLTGEVDNVYLLYNSFKSVLSAKVTLQKLLPIALTDLLTPPLKEPQELSSLLKQAFTSFANNQVQQVQETVLADNEIIYLYEPTRQKLVDSLAPRYVNTLIWQALLESLASEYGARMSSMDNATKNAETLIDKLSLAYNRGRQANITKELMEIIGGAEGLG